MINKKDFFDSIRKSLFGGSLTDKQVLGVESILNACEKEGISDKRQIAYVLATAYHETGRTMEPVREGYAKTDEVSIATVTRMYNNKRISKNYSLPAANGKSFFGRGFVQLTWDYNYKTMGKLLGIDLYNHPELALEQETAALILSKGMSAGSFTGRKLNSYINDKITDFVSARKIINGLDMASTIAKYAVNFHNSLK